MVRTDLTKIINDHSVDLNGRYLIRTSDLHRVEVLRYRCANRPTPPPGFEPGTGALTVRSSTAELRRNFKGADLLDTLSAAGGVSHLYPGKHLAGTPSEYTDLNRG